MTIPHRAPSGRPGLDEFASYASGDIGRVRGDDAVEVLSELGRRTVALLAPLEEDKVAGLSYGPDKWTLKEVVGHIIDDERIFAYRALCIARGERRSLPGFDEKEYAHGADFESRSLASLLIEYQAVREASLALFSSLTSEAWMRRGVVTDYEASVRGLAFHIAGHELHHIRILNERYLSQLA